MLAAFEKYPKLVIAVLSFFLPFATLGMWAYPAYTMTIRVKKTVRGVWRALS
jgi:hypothetical protein